MEYHVPVLAQACIDLLNINPQGTYVDATFGGGGHAKLILNELSDKGRLYGFDQDEDALQNSLADDRFTLVQHNFRHLKRFLKLYKVKQVDGILADLGVSSFQLNEERRGFSYRFDVDLDMRMNQQGEITAAKVLNTYSEEDLVQVFSRYGEVRNSKTLAAQIVEERRIRKFARVGDFLHMLEPLVRGSRARYLAQVFQALRIEVNDEMGALKDLLTQAKELLRPNGRLVIISYHSLEDRLVKQFLKTGNVQGELQKDFYGNIHRPFKLITKKAIVPTPDEIKKNSRSRSAKLRAGERVKTQE